MRFQTQINRDEEGRRLLLPFFVYVDRLRDEIYVIDGRNRVIIYNTALYPLLTLDKRRGVTSPLALTVDAEGNLYIIQAPTEETPFHRVSVFDRACFWQKDIIITTEREGEQFKPYRIAVNRRSEIYLAGQNFRGVLLLDQEGALKGLLAPVEEGKRAPIIDVKIDDEGRVYLVNITDSKIYVYDEDNRFLFKFGEKGGVTGKLSQPKSVGVDVRRQMVYVVDYMRHTISAYSRERGKFLFEFGGKGWSPGWFQFPSYLDVDSRGRVIVADTFNRRIQVFEPMESSGGEQ